MLDIKLIRESPEIVENDLKKRGEKGKIELLHDLIRSDKERRELIQKVEQLRRQRNEITEKISMMTLKEVSQAIIEHEKKIAALIPPKIKNLQEHLEQLNSFCHNALMQLPNILDKSVPVGKDETENVEIRRWGKKEFDFEPKNHLEVALGLDLIDLERAAKVSGERFYYIKKELALLDMAVQRFALDYLVKKGFVVTEPPFMIKRKAYEGVVDLKDFEHMIYKIQDEDLYMIATSEHPMAAMHMDEVLNKDDLPIKLAGVSPCFRKELGAHGKYEKGLFRMHHFNKVEQFVFCLPEHSWKTHEELQHNVEDMMQQLGIPFRIVNCCTGDMGSIASKKYDTEFLMADGKYREIGSNSNCTDYQARRLNVRWREKEGVAPSGFVHTLNSTALVTSRVMVAILENFQRSDGSVDIPKVLWPYTGFKRIE